MVWYGEDRFVELFAQRTLANVNQIKRIADSERKKNPEDRSAFEVTNLVCALLGLVVIPYASKHSTSWRDKWSDLPTLSNDGVVIEWPNGRPRHIHELVECIRHAACHNGISFEPELQGQDISHAIFASDCGTVRLSIDQLRNIMVWIAERLKGK